MTTIGRVLSAVVYYKLLLLLTRLSLLISKTDGQRHIRDSATSDKIKVNGFAEITLASFLISRMSHL